MKSAIAGFDKVLIANRGEIAVRIARTLRELGIASAVVTHPNEGVNASIRAADEVLEIEGESPVAAYLDVEQMVDVARRVGADAVHPGYGFLSENGAFARAVEAAGIRFVGPSAEAMQLMGDKIGSRSFVAERGFPVAPSAIEEEAPASFLARAEAVGFPLVVKASAGGGGKGMHIVHEAGGLEPAISLARSEAERYFGDGRLYAERYLDEPRHIEVQILADAHGNCVHLFERECSIQRRFQKLIEESPSPTLDSTLRERICNEAVGIASAAGYVNAGTVEFIMDRSGEFFFLEMNTRLQVEHPVTELVTGIDLVAEQLRVAAGQVLRFSQEEIQRRGWAIECRICAEDAGSDFLPAIGSLHRVRVPEGPGLRFDGGVVAGQAVSADFDPMLAKLIAHGVDRDEAISRARQGLRDTVLLGVTHNASYLERVLAHPAFVEGKTHTGFLAEHREELREETPSGDQRALLLAAAALADGDFLARASAVPEPYASIGAWRN
jgi:propionyl-CoA carboxylase alpha chain/3-methylcrotonyl-CoA carboxylase alpha subunit/acetyl-CoA/propionyl-CoA carboxylase biotin carboxyl carrier protein